MCQDPYLGTPGLACGRKAGTTTASPLIVLLSTCSSGGKGGTNLSCAFALSQGPFGEVWGTRAGLAHELTGAGQAFLWLGE